ncbi:MAG TPA: alpha/beta hydrolase [Caulobacteraceae bacterium]|nr:alpha/beta hydrolase [Caulobacteraceae bacterium]
MYLEINGARIFVDTVGSALAIDGERMAERPGLIVLHGGPGFDHSTLRPYFDRFADTHQVFFVDHRGNGRSTGEPDTWRLDQWGDDVKAVADALGLEKPIVYGLSFGGMVAQAYATRHPDHPARLVLASTAARMDLPATYAMMEELGGVRAREIAADFWTDPTVEGAGDYMSVCMPLYNPRPPEESAAARRRAIQRLEVMFHFIHGEQRSMDFRADLAKVRCPTLILAGARDPITPVSCSREILAAIPSGLADLQVFENAGHGVHRDEPDRAEAALRAFFGR